MKYVTLFLSLALAACSTTKYEVKEVDTSIQVYGQIDGQKIGIDKDKQVIIQQETTAAGELKVQQLENYETERQLETAYNTLSQCRQEIADPRLGGNGGMKEIPEIDNMRSTPEVREQIGLTKTDELKVVKREFYIERLKLERQYGQTMKEMLHTFKRFNRACTQEMSVSRVSHGLPANRYDGKGTFDSAGNWIMERPMEHTLDDAFVIKASLAKE